MSKRAVILAGGRGKRLRPYTITLPKPLMPIGDYPILEIIIRQLAAQGFDHITLAVNHQAEIIKAFFQNGERWGIKIDYSMEDQPLGTMGPLKNIPDLPENFLVMNGDILTDLSYQDFFNWHEESANLFSICSYHREHLVDYGVLETKDKKLTGMKEKPRLDYEVSTGIYMLSRDVLESIPENQPFGFDELMHRFIEEKKTVRVHSHTGYWLDIGRSEDYKTATNVFLDNEEKFLPTLRLHG
jgi:NDP-sugar pyrophosphorylase family protein